MYIRVEITTRRVKHLSVPPFTVVLNSDEADYEIVDAPPPGPVKQLRISTDLKSLEIDPTIPVIPDPRADLRNRFDQATTLMTLKEVLREILGL